MGVATRSYGLLVSTLLLLAGCSGGQPSPTPALSRLQPDPVVVTPSGSPTPTPVVAEPSQESRPPDEVDPVDTGPLAPYVLTPTETAELYYAYDAMVGDCMRSFGASWGHESLAVYRRAAQDVLKYTTSWEYGVTDPHTPYTGGPPALPVTHGDLNIFLLQGRRNPNTGGPPALETESPGEVDGRPLPPGGCQGQAWRALEDEGGIGWSSRAVDFWTLAATSTPQQPGYAEAIRPWRECMASRGFTVTDPIFDTGDIQAANDRGTDMGQPYPEEMVLVEADVACKSETNLVETLTPLRMAAQQQVLDEHRAELEADRAMLNNKVALARAWISEHGSDAAP